jgi:hypothetical protein
MAWGIVREVLLVGFHPIHHLWASVARDISDIKAFEIAVGGK